MSLNPQSSYRYLFPGLLADPGRNSDTDILVSGELFLSSSWQITSQYCAAEFNGQELLKLSLTTKVIG